MHTVTIAYFICRAMSHEINQICIRWNMNRCVIFFSISYLDSVLVDQYQFPTIWCGWWDARSAIDPLKEDETADLYQTKIVVPFSGVFLRKSSDLFRIRQSSRTAIKSQCGGQCWQVPLNSSACRGKLAIFGICLTVDIVGNLLARFRIRSQTRPKLSDRNIMRVCCRTSGWNITFNGDIRYINLSLIYIFLRLGTKISALLFGSSVVSSVTILPLLLRRLSPRKCLIVAEFSYAVYTLANLHPSE